MAYITVAGLKDYLKAFPDNDNEFTRYVNAAMQTVNSYIGFDPENSSRTETVKGKNYYQLPLRAMPITAITSIVVDREAISLDNVAVSADSDNSNYIEFTDGSIFTAGKRYTVTYTAGWITVPPDIVNAAYRIAGVLYAESDGNIGISSKSFGESGSRVFLNSSLKKYLDEISSYKIVRNLC